MHTNSIWKRKIGVVIEAAYNPRGLIISESRIFCSCANPLGRIFEIAEILASYIQFLRNKKAQLHFVAVLFLLCKLRTGRLVCIAKIGGVGKVPLRLSKCMLVSAVAYMRLTPFMRISANCRDLYASNPWGDRLWIAEVLICAQSLRGLSLNSTGVVDMRPTAVIGELRLSDLSLVGWGANRDWREWWRQLSFCI